MVKEIKINSDFSVYKKAFLEENAKHNLISKNDEKFLWEKHIYDSLSLELFFDKYGLPQNILDIGTGGGFPSVPIAIKFPQIEVWALDSIAKKINAIENIKSELKLENLHTICSRVEAIKEQKFEVIVSRAMASLDKLIKYTENKIQTKGYFVAFKSRLIDEELEAAKPILKKSALNLIDVIDYELPTEEKHVRKLVIFQHS